MTKARGLADLGNVYSDAALSNRNLIINGAMQVAQRGTSTAGITGGNFLTCDRFYFALSTLGTWTGTQASDGPSGFANSFKLECTAANASPAAGNFAFVSYSVEGQDLQQLAKGTSGAKPATLSFWVNSNVTGTYQVTFLDSDNTRNIAGTYTIDASATWEYKTITIAGDTVGAFDDDVNFSLGIEWWLGSGTNFTSGAVPTAWETAVSADRNAGGAVNVASTIGNTWQITGVQLEAGDTATPFEHRSYGQDLALCKRYYERITKTTHSSLANGAYFSGGAPYAVFRYATKRVAPTCSPSNSAAINILRNSVTVVSTNITFEEVSTDTARILANSAATTSGAACWYQLNLAGDFLQIDAEL